PRSVLGLLAGAALGVAGALIQAVTRNPLADPGILGVNSGSAFAIALGVGLFGASSPGQYLWFAFAGALVATVVVYLIGASGSGSVSPARITLAGMALGAVLSGITSAMRLADDRRFSVIQAWQAGSFADRGWDVIVPTLPFLAAGLVIAALLGRSLDAIALSDDLARALGTNVNRARLLALAAITLLAGGATAMVGPIVFVGLMVPHVARWISGPRQGWIMVLCLVYAPVLVLAADVLGRIVLRPGEVAVSIVTAFIGGPVLIYLVRRTKAGKL
ncbi:Fe(3+)-siderophore ABC transporter permease, partial [Propionibacterium freudenreichii]